MQWPHKDLIVNIWLFWPWAFNGHLRRSDICHGFVGLKCDPDKRYASQRPWNTSFATLISREKRAGNQLTTGSKFRWIPRERREQAPNYNSYERYADDRPNIVMNLLREIYWQQAQNCVNLLREMYWQQTKNCVNLLREIWTDPKLRWISCKRCANNRLIFVNPLREMCWPQA